MEVKVNNRCINGKCSGCGECCTDFLPLTKHEIKVITEYLEKHPEIEEQYKNLSKEFFDVRCAFLNEKTHRCLIYPVRPSICRTFQCNKCSKVLTINRDKHFYKADINTININNIFNGMDKMCSTHSLFFNNKQWDINFIAAYAKQISGNNFDKFREILPQLVEYFIYKGKKDFEEL